MNDQPPGKSSARDPITTATEEGIADVFSSNEVRLSVGQWYFVALVLLGVIIGLPRLWKHEIPFDAPEDYRVPYALSQDYWTYERWLDHATRRDRHIVLLGDSVIWGEYVTPTQSLARWLSQRNRPWIFVNGGLNGVHPLALEGLVDYYGGPLAEQPVLLHCNLLWMSSPERDLQSDKEVFFNHPALVPQFFPRIPCYRATVNDRLGIVVDHYSPFRQWVQHTRTAFFDGQDLQNWSLEHPYRNPLSEIHPHVVLPEDRPHSPPIAWTRRGMTRQDIPWVDLATSLQWHAFQRTVDQLVARGCRLFVLIGPFNEHLLTDASRHRYQARRAEVRAWLSSRGLFVFEPEPLPTEEYADASHPLAAGYRRLADQLSEQPAFHDWLSEARR